MIIETVKIQGEGYLVNNTLSVPKADGNRDYEAVKKWIANGGIVGAEFSSTKLLEQAISAKAIEISNDFATAESVPVELLGFKFFGGAESVTAIDGYIRLQRLAGNTFFTIWDEDGAEHDLTSAEADQLLLAIGGIVSLNKFNKKNRKVALSQAITIEEVELV